MYIVTLEFGHSMLRCGLWASEYVWFFQNAMRATMELYGDALEYPPVQAQVALGHEDLTIKVQSRPISSVEIWAWGFLRWSSSTFPLVPLPYYVVCWPVQVSDRGGGVPLRKIDRLFTYTYSTAPRPLMDSARATPLVSEHQHHQFPQSCSTCVPVEQTSQHEMRGKGVWIKSLLVMIGSVMSLIQPLLS